MSTGATLFYARALYDFDAADPSCISFRTNDVLEILRTDTGAANSDGWWDGVLGQERGWIPSNHVVRIDLPPPAPTTQPPRRPSVDTTATTIAIATANANGNVNRLVSEESARRPSPSEYWLPQVDGSGQVFYRNERTGEQSAVLPTFPDNGSPVYDGSWAAIDFTARASPSPSREYQQHADDPGASTFLTVDGIPLPSSAGSVRPRQLHTPSGWVRRVASDGTTPYYQNTADGSVQWTRPNGSEHEFGYGDYDYDDDNVRTAVPPNARTPLAGTSSGALSPNGGGTGTFLLPNNGTFLSPYPVDHLPPNYGDPPHSGSGADLAASFSLPPSASPSSHSGPTSASSYSTSDKPSVSTRPLVAANPDVHAPAPAYAPAPYVPQSSSASLPNPANVSSSSSSANYLYPTDEKRRSFTQQYQPPTPAPASAPVSGPSSYFPDPHATPETEGDALSPPPPAYHYAAGPPTAFPLLQRPPTPPPAPQPSLDDLVVRARGALDAVTALFTDSPNGGAGDNPNLDEDDPPPYDATVPEALAELSAALRELFYTTALPLSDIPPALSPTASSPASSPTSSRPHSHTHQRSSISSSHSHTHGGISSHMSSRARINDLRLRPAQRKVTSALSKLVLVAHSAKPGGSASTGLANGLAGIGHARLRTYAAEVRAALDAFVAEVRAQRNQDPEPDQDPETGFGRRLQGTLSLSQTGPSPSREFDWLAPLDDNDAARRALDEEVVSELKARAGEMKDHLEAFERDIGAGDLIALHLHIKKLFSCCTGYIDLCANIHVAPAVQTDMEGTLPLIPPAALPAFTAHILRANETLLGLEGALGALRADAAALFVMMQTGVCSRPCDGGTLDDADATRDSRCARAARLIASLKALPGVVNAAFARLLDAGREQALIARGAGHAPSALGAELEDVVDMELALATGAGLAPPPPLREHVLRNQVSDAWIQRHTDEYEREHEVMERERRARPVSQGARASVEDEGTDESAGVGSNVSHVDLMLESEVGHGYSMEVAGPSVPSVIDIRREEYEDEPQPRSPSSPSDVDSDNLSLFSDSDSLTGGSKAAQDKAAHRSTKLMWLIGADAPRHYLDSMDEADKPWYLRPTAGPNEIQVDPDGTVRGGTIPALVERLTTHEKSDIKFNQAFLMTYRSFMTPDELCDQLFARFAITPPDELNPKELEEWNMIKQHIVQTRVLNTLRTMVLDEELDPEGEDAEMLERIKAFANSAFASSEQPSQQAAAKALGNLTERVQHGYSPVRKVVSTEQPPQPIVPRSVNRKLLPTDIDPLELARQLSIIESQLFQKIRPAECFARAQGRHRTDDNIAVLIKTSNRIVNWLADCVLGKESPVQRAAVVKHFINVADKCRELNNFSSMWAIVSGLNRPHIRRLKRTWEHVDNRTTQRFRACEALLDSTLNFENYRMALHNASPPGVPFFGRFMSALTFIEDGNQDRLGDEMINFVKRQRSADIVTRIKLWQSKPYSFKPVPIIQTYLDESLTRFSDDEHLRDYFWNLSLRREPREREDERMNRLLYESGFL